jgi:hypothetical protein
MEAEHCYMRGHDFKFDCSLHYEPVESQLAPPKTSAKEEWNLLVHGTQPEWLRSGKFQLKGLYLKGGRKAAVYRDFPKTDDRPAGSLCDAERLGLALYTGPMVRCVHP